MRKKATLGHCRSPEAQVGTVRFMRETEEEEQGTEVDRTWGGLGGGRQDLRPQKGSRRSDEGNFHSQVITGHGEVDSEGNHSAHAHTHT